jgi:hypothetical protein
MSQEYALSIAILLGSALKLFGVEIENKILEGLVFGAASLWIAVRRYKRGDISVGGIRK